MPVPMPTLGEYLQRLLNEGKLSSHLYKFIRLWGDDLFNRTHGNPTKNYYHNYSLTITNEYPVLEDRTGNGTLNVSMIKCCISSFSFFFLLFALVFYNRCQIGELGGKGEKKWSEDCVWRSNSLLYCLPVVWLTNALFWRVEQMFRSQSHISFWLTRFSFFNIWKIPLDPAMKGTNGLFFILS